MFSVFIPYLWKKYLLEYFPTAQNFLYSKVYLSPPVHRDRLPTAMIHSFIRQKIYCMALRVVGDRYTKKPQLCYFTTKHSAPINILR